MYMICQKTLEAWKCIWFVKKH